MTKLTDAAQGAWILEALKEYLSIEFAKREAITLTILAEEFGFTTEQLDRYADLKMEKITEARGE